MKIAGSFLKIQNDKGMIDKLNDVVDIMHYDVMDGDFTENKTISYDEMVDNTKDVTKPKDIHLMVTDIYHYVDLYSELKPNNITFHVEIGDTLDIIEYIKGKGIKVGLAFNPASDVSVIEPFLSLVDVVLVMSVVPGKGGQKFIDISHKINYLTEYRDDNNLEYLIEVDGGINDETVSNVLDVDIVVIGSYITDSTDYEKQVRKVKRYHDKRNITNIIIAIVLIIVLVLVILI